MENKKIKLYIVDIEEKVIERLEGIFYTNPHLGIKIIGYAYNYNGCINDFSRARDADVFLVSAYLPDTMGTELISQIKKVNPKAKVIVSLQKNTRNLAEVSKEKGADDFIQKPFKARQIMEKVFDVMGRNMEEEQNTSPAPTVSPDMSFEPMEPIDLEEYTSTELEHDLQDSGQNRRAIFDAFSENPLTQKIYTDNEELDGDKPNTVCVFASAGSNGKTTMLVNTAIAIHKHSQYKPRICILDFNFLFPSVMQKFHHDDLLLCKKNVFDLFDDINNLSEELISSALNTHEPTGIKILETPSDSIRDLSRVNSESIQQLIVHLREMFDLILIDTSTNIRDDATSFPLTIADKGIVLLEPDLSNLLHTRKLIFLLKTFESNLSEKIVPKLHFVLNKENSKAIIHVDTIKKTLFNTDIRLTIPEDTLITQLANNGQFIVDTNFSSARSIKELARVIYPFDQELFSLKQPNKKQGIFSSLPNLFKKK